MIRASSLFSSAALVTVTGALVTTGSAPPQDGPDAAPNSYVRLQGSTPGTQQSGHANISGTLMAGQFQGGGAGLSGVNADLLDGLNSTAFLQSIPVPLTLSGNSSTHIIRGQNSSTGSTSSGVFGFSTATSGETYGGRFVSNSTSGGGVYGVATAASGFTTGVIGQTGSTSGRGVFGFAIATSGFTYGGRFENNSTSGVGVYGHAAASSGITIGVFGLSDSTQGIGVYGFVGANSGATKGVFGESLSPSGHAVYAAGNFAATGTKSFRIDHPFDPENKYLVHYCSEGPEPLNVYSGVITTDAQGFAAIPLPDYFAEINRDPRVQLTVDDESEDFVFAKVLGGVKNGVCRIRTSKPLVKVYWEVKAVRNDRWVQKYGAPVEPEKEGRERGKYQHPELYGMPKEMGMNYRPPEKTSRRPKK